MGLTLSCRRQSPWICVVFCLVWLRPRFVLFRCFLCWRNANLAGRFACRRCWRVFSRCVGFSMICLAGEAKVFHTFCTLFYRFSHCQDRALERDRPQQRKQKTNPRNLLGNLFLRTWQPCLRTQQPCLRSCSWEPCLGVHKASSAQQCRPGLYATLPFCLFLSLLLWVCLFLFGLFGGCFCLFLFFVWFFLLHSVTRFFSWLFSRLSPLSFRQVDQHAVEAY